MPPRFSTDREREGYAAFGQGKRNPPGFLDDEQKRQWRRGNSIAESEVRAPRKLPTTPPSIKVPVAKVKFSPEVEAFKESAGHRAKVLEAAGVLATALEPGTRNIMRQLPPEDQAEVDVLVQSNISNADRARAKLELEKRNAAHNQRRRNARVKIEKLEAAGKPVPPELRQRSKDGVTWVPGTIHRGSKHVPKWAAAPQQGVVLIKPETSLEVRDEVGDRLMDRIRGFSTVPGRQTIDITIPIRSVGGGAVDVKGLPIDLTLAEAGKIGRIVASYAVAKKAGG